LGYDCNVYTVVQPRWLVLRQISRWRLVLERREASQYTWNYADNDRLR